ncbi:RNA polymerase sigma factor SigJ [Micromonospora parathelypteridis]|uniref:RNA polymerase sigma-70 factor (ECF subfamily) n=1 Tax=Micromonospora parathelypteridis TaxID=1839617 RepID=A0A840VK61_9ACTN|nr:RNA polymerase sigma factor SigJ [Micromonospora parathelypteridis]MBB5477045.1 RNA polymerase sigma-70 factor (ECF subfamily) [Micromonospora parathelypteridis]GGO18243.1 RNA polymerase sigma factor SigJ [Micromonospora parathelypteridis]
MTTEAAEAAGALQAHRPMLLGLAYRLLGSRHDAEDVLQETYLRWLGVDRSAVGEPRRYLSRVVTRLALDRLRARQAAHETYVGTWLPEPVPTTPSPFGPLDHAELRDSLSTALLHVLERLTPPERAVYVLHTAFELPYTEIGEILDRSAADCRQLHHRATARVRQEQRRFTASRSERERLLNAFLAAAQDGDLQTLTGLVASDAVAWNDGGGRVRAALNPVGGADRIARFYAGIYGPRHPMTIERVELNGEPAVVITRADGTRYTLTIAAAGGQITRIYVVGNPTKLQSVD